MRDWSDRIPVIARPFVHLFRDNRMDNDEPTGRRNVLPGSMRKRGEEPRRLRLHAARDPITNRKRHVEGTFRGTKRQASKALAEMVTDADGRAARSAKEGTLGALLNEWLDHAWVRWRQVTGQRPHHRSSCPKCLRWSRGPGGPSSERAGAGRAGLLVVRRLRPRCRRVGRRPEGRQSIGWDGIRCWSWTEDALRTSPDESTETSMPGMIRKALRFVDPICKSDDLAR